MLSAPGAQREGGGGEIFSRQWLFAAAISRDAATGIVLADTQASYAPLATAARLQSPLCARLFGASSGHACTHLSLATGSTLGTNQRLVRFWTSTNPSCHVGRFGHSGSNAGFVPLDSAGAQIPHVLGRGKGSRARATDGRTRAELWRNPTLVRAGELEGRKGRERGKINGSGKEGGN